MHLEQTYKGKGRLAEENRAVIASADYEVLVFRTTIPDGFGGDILGTASIRGSLQDVGPSIMSALAQAQKDLILLMDSDGLELRIFVSGLDTFTGRGGQPQPIAAR
jgi:hypothetical protein